MDLILRASLALLGFLTPLVSASATPVPTSEPPSNPAPDDPETSPPAEASQSETTQPPTSDPATTQPGANGPEGGSETTSVAADPTQPEPTTTDPSAGDNGAAEPCSEGAGEPAATSTTLADGGDSETSTPSDTTGVAACDSTLTTVAEGGGEGETVEPSPATTPPPTTSPTTTVPADPLANEQPPEAVPETDETVPAPGGAYAGQTGFQPAEVLWSSVRAAETKLVEARRTQEDRIDAARQIRRQHKELRVAHRSLGDEARQAAVEINDAQTTLTERAVAAFVNDDALSNAIIGSFDAADHEQILELRIRRRLLDTVLDQDEDAIRDYLALRSEIDADVLTGLDTLRSVERALRYSTSEAESAAEDVVEAENELEAFTAGSAIYIDDVVFPVGDGYGLPLIDSYGFPRMPGTPDEHWHEGIDIFAPSGTPLVATERGVVTRVGSGRLGGLTVWLRGESGTDWYYAHLLSHAPGLVEGMVVDGGDLLGYVGNTGNARTTPAHLHMQVHPGGGDPVNPYPLLKVISDRDQSRLGP